MIVHSGSSIRVRVISASEGADDVSFAARVPEFMSVKDSML